MTNARLEELRAKFQENPRRYFAPFANELRKAGDPAQAIAVCRAHLAGQPGHVSGHIVLGQALYEAGESSEARETFTAALELDPENLIALRTLGEIAQVNGEFDAAREWYERLLDADPRNNEVAQLLKDIPSQAPTASVASAPLPDVAEEPTPLSVRLDAESPPPAPEPTPPSTFHTSFSGSGPAYKPEEPEPEAVAASESSEESAEPFINLEPTAHDEYREPDAEPELAPARAAADATQEMVDFDIAPEAPTVEARDDAPASEYSEPATDEAPPSPRADAVVPSTNETEAVESTTPGAEADETVSPGAFAFEPETSEAEEEPLEFDAPDEIEEEPALPESHFATPEAFAPVEEAPESPRARFAEHGFEGPPDDDEVGWMTTPSAAYSDLEAAPQDWLDESAALEAEDVGGATPALEAEDVSSAASVETPAEMKSVNPVIDSWFDDVEGAAVIESTDVTRDEFWLPPELPHVTAAEAAIPPAEAEADEPVAATVEEGSSWAPPAPAETVASGEQPDEPAPPSWSPSDDFTAAEEEPAFDEPPAIDEEPIAVAETLEETDQPWMASAVAPAAEPSPLDVDALSDAREDAVVVDHPVEVPSASTSTESEAPASEPDEVADQASLETGTEVIYAGAESIDVAPRSDSVIGHTPEFQSEPAQPAPAPFITETLAELYLQQGFREEALAIYRRLAERDPHDPGLAKRIAAIEQGESPEPVRADVPAETRAASQSVRTFFSRLARRAAVRPLADEPEASSAPSGANPDVPFASAASALANLFSASRPPASDESAAANLAGAFSDPAGRPSRAADRELSLDHLFRDVASGGSTGGGVTLDEFYATPDAAPGSPTESGEAEGSEDSGGTDIRQFTAWLEGLRKK